MKKIYTFLVILLAIHFFATSTFAATNTVDYFIYNDTIYKLDFQQKVEKKSLVNLIGLLEIKKKTKNTSFVNQTNKLMSGLAIYELKDASPDQFLAIEISNEFYLSIKTDVADVIYYVKEEVVELEQQEEEITYSTPEQTNTTELAPIVASSNQEISDSTTIEEKSTDVPSEETIEIDTIIEETTTKQVSEIIISEKNIGNHSDVQKVEEIQELEKTDDSKQQVSEENIVIVPEIERPATIVEENSNTLPPTPTKQPVIEETTTKKEIKKEIPPSQPPVAEQKEETPTPIAETTNLVLGLEKVSEQESFQESFILTPAAPATSLKETIAKNNFSFMIPLLAVVTFLILLTFITYRVMNKNENQRDG